MLAHARGSAGPRGRSGRDRGAGTRPGQPGTAPCQSPVRRDREPALCSAFALRGCSPPLAGDISRRSGIKALKAQRVQRHTPTLRRHSSLARHPQRGSSFPLQRGRTIRAKRVSLPPASPGLVPPSAPQHSSGLRRGGGSAGPSGDRDVPAPAAHTPLSARLKARQEPGSAGVGDSRAPPASSRAQRARRAQIQRSLLLLPPRSSEYTKVSVHRRLPGRGGGGHAEPTAPQTSSWPRAPGPEPDGTAALCARRAGCQPGVTARGDHEPRGEAGKAPGPLGSHPSGGSDAGVGGSGGGPRSRGWGSVPRSR